MNVPYTTSWTCAPFAKSHQIAIDQKHSPQKNMESTATRIAALQVTYTWPHAHWAENLVAISAAWVLPGGTAFYLYGNEVGG